MAKRPVFISCDDTVGVKILRPEFQWHPGMSIKQKQKSIASLHSAAAILGVDSILEVSSKSPLELGVRMSAFNLSVKTNETERVFTVETAFQSSKVFDKGGPYLDLFFKPSRKAKKDPRLYESGNLKHFLFNGKTFDLRPRTFFYDWLYINALKLNPNIAEAAHGFDAFTDIEFNPQKSINCQAYSAALYVSLVSNKLVQDALRSPEAFLAIVADEYEKRDREISVQGKML